MSFFGDAGEWLDQAIQDFDNLFEGDNAVESEKVERKMKYPNTKCEVYTNFDGRKKTTNLTGGPGNVTWLGWQ